VIACYSPSGRDYWAATSKKRCWQPWTPRACSNTCSRCCCYTGHIHKW